MAANRSTSAGKGAADGRRAGPRAASQLAVGLLVAGVAWVTRHARLTLAAAVVLTALSAYGVTTLGVNTNTTDLLSHDLEFRRTYAAYQAEFPLDRSNVVIVIDGVSIDAAEDAARRLYGRLMADREHFETVFFPQGETYFRKYGLLYLSKEKLGQLSDRISTAQPLLAELSRDPSLRGLFGILTQAVDRLGTKDAKPAGLAPVLDRITAVTEARLQGGNPRLAWAEVLAGGETSPRDRRRIIVVRPKLDFDSLSPAKRAMDRIRALGREVGIAPANGLSLRLTGSAAINSEELKSVTAGAQLAGILSFVFVTVLLILGLRSVRFVVAVVVTLVVGLLWTAGFAALAVGTLNMISVAFAVLFIGLGVDFGIHFALRCREERHADVDRRTAIVNAARGVGAGLVLSAAAAAVAFLSFLPTEYRGVSELGLIAGAGMILALIVSLTVLPAILALWPERHDLRALPDWHEGGAGRALQNGLHRARAPIVAVAVLLAIAGVALAPGATFDRNPLNLKDPSTESVRTAVDLMSDPDAPTTGIVVVADDMAAAAKLAARLKKLPSVRGARTVQDFIPTDQQDKLDIIEEMSLVMLPVLKDGKKLPPPDTAERRRAAGALVAAIGKALAEKRAGELSAPLSRLAAALATYRQKGGDWDRLDTALVSNLPARLDALRDALSAGPVKFSTLPASIRAREISTRGRIRVFVTPRGDLRDAETLQTFVDEVTGVAPNATGSPVVEHRAGDQVVNAFILATAIASVLIVLALLALMRRLRDVLLVLVPVVIAGAVTIGVTVVFGIPFNFANIIVVPLLIGLGVASGIHLVMRARLDGGRLMGTSTPRAVLFSALTTVASFGSLAVSGHRGTASMGELLMIAISLTLVCALVVLPGVLGLVYGRSADGAKVEDAAK